MTAIVKLDTTKLNQLIASVPDQSDKIVKQAAFMIEQRAKMNITGWPLVDTGALLNSIEAEKMRQGVWHVHDGVEYGLFWELGHKNLFMRRYVRKPFLGPAVQYVTALYGQMFAKGLIK